MGKPDALSRWADHGSGQGDNDNLTLLAPELFRIHALAGIRLEGDECNILQEVWRSLRDNVQEESVAKAARELRKDKGRGTIKSAEWSESDGLLMFCGKIYVPNDRDLRCRIVEQHHDTRIAGHAGHFKTLELVSHNYWWPQMSCYIGIYVKHCDLCNQTKVQCRRPIGELHPSETPQAPWETISVDFIVELLESHGYDAIMCVVDSLTKRAHFILMHTTINAEGMALLFLKEVVRGHQSISLPPLSSPLLSHTLFSPTFSPGPYVHSPTLCTITRCQTLKADNPWISKTPTRILVDVYCRRPFPSPLCSYL
jgi:hypothetical protein